MSRTERFSNRDWAWSVFHRSIPHPARMIDLDYIEYCNICSKPIVLGEVARDVGQNNKATTVLKRLCCDADAVGIRIFYKREPILQAVSMTLHEPAPNEMPSLDKDQLAEVWNFLSTNQQPILRIKLIYPENKHTERQMTAKQFQEQIYRLHAEHDVKHHPDRMTIMPVPTWSAETRTA